MMDNNKNAWYPEIEANIEILIKQAEQIRGIKVNSARIRLIHEHQVYEEKVIEKINQFLGEKDSKYHNYLEIIENINDPDGRAIALRAELLGYRASDPKSEDRNSHKPH